MRGITAFILFLLVFASTARAQDTLPPPEVDMDTVPYSYPFTGAHSPPWFGIIGGYEGFRTHCWEAGLILNIAGTYSRNNHGHMVSVSVTWKQSFSGQMKTIEGAFGIYTPFSIGVGLNQNFSGSDATFGIRPFIGTSWWHFQVLAGYNFYSKKQEIEELDHFTVKVNYALPLFEVFRY